MVNNLKIYELLGARIFQKFVFKAEDIKYMVIDKFFPNVAVDYEKKLRRNLNNKLKIVKTDEERQKAIDCFRNNVLTLRRELNGKKNRNYHIKVDNPTEFVKYLKSNRSIHVRGLIHNGVVFVITIAGIVFGEEIPIIQRISYVWLGCNSVSTLINFQCVNLQNYNLKRIENSKERLEGIAKKKRDRDIKRYGEISTVISREFDSTDKIPEKEDIIRQITTKEQLVQMRKLLVDNMYPNKNNVINNRVKQKNIKEG